MPARKYRNELQNLYCRLNKREFVDPDPLQLLYRYEDSRDREIAALVASSLAYGAVRQIVKTVSIALDRIDPPHAFVMSASRDDLVDLFADFKYRFTTGGELATMLHGVRRVIERHGSLEACFVRGMEDRCETLMPALSALVRELSSVFEGRPRSLLPSPDLGSACKRHNLFLRWMVRCDEVDPGGWSRVPASKLIAPVDVHMRRIGLRLGLTKRRQADMRAAIEITDAFRAIAPDDPVRFDFCLTRLGIRDDVDPGGFLEACRVSGGPD